VTAHKAVLLPSWKPHAIRLCRDPSDPSDLRDPHHPKPLSLTLITVQLSSAGSEFNLFDFFRVLPSFERTLKDLSFRPYPFRLESLATVFVSPFREDQLFAEIFDMTLIRHY
jgi:hypothetical protein